MREFYGPTPGWYDPPEAHDDDCTCDRCHELHKENGIVPDLEKSHSCCQKQVLDWILSGVWCLTHGNAHMEKSKCLACLDEARRILMQASNF